jgi:hypothetical protein
MNYWWVRKTALAQMRSARPSPPVKIALAKQDEIKDWVAVLFSGRLLLFMARTIPNPGITTSFGREELAWLKRVNTFPKDY